MDATALVSHLADTARKAARTLVASTGAQRKAALLAIADEIEKRSDEIIALPRDVTFVVDAIKDGKLVEEWLFYDKAVLAEIFK